jgi:hypothetical protein
LGLRSGSRKYGRYNLQLFSIRVNGSDQNNQRNAHKTKVVEHIPIKSLEISNFKSIKHLRLRCRRVNLFIGEPNNGKSSILEAIGLLSHVFHGRINKFLRFAALTDLFYPNILEEKFE